MQVSDGYLALMRGTPLLGRVLLPEDQRSAQLYFPHAQFPAGYMTLVVKCASDPVQLAAAVRARIRTVDKDQPRYDVASMEEAMADATAMRRFSLVLLAIFRESL